MVPTPVPVGVPEVGEGVPPPVRSPVVVPVGEVGDGEADVVGVVVLVGVGVAVVVGAVCSTRWPVPVVPVLAVVAGVGGRT